MNMTMEQIKYANDMYKGKLELWCDKITTVDHAFSKPQNEAVLAIRRMIRTVKGEG